MKILDLVFLPDTKGQVLVVARPVQASPEGDCSRGAGPDALPTRSARAARRGSSREG